MMIKTNKGSADLDDARLRQQAIGARLRQLFDDVVNEPVPDDFLDILRRADPSPHGSLNGASAGKKSDLR